MSTVNIVKYYFHKLNRPDTEERMRKLVALAYQTARDRQIYPSAVFIRSDIHYTTSINGKRQKDPLGPHITLCYKNQEQLTQEVHIAAHGYVSDVNTMAFKQATHGGQKPDHTIKNKKGKVVWPAMEELWEAPDVGYGHLEKPRDK